LAAWETTISVSKAIAPMVNLPEIVIRLTFRRIFFVCLKVLRLIDQTLLKERMFSVNKKYA
jgi:hypothetical protein